MMKRNKKDELVVEYDNGDGRVARIFSTPKGFEVDLLEESALVETRKIHEHSKYYAEDVAENWCNGLISI